MKVNILALRIITLNQITHNTMTLTTTALKIRKLWTMTPSIRHSAECHSA
jgi:hypothetical protein